jgi:hypothetical protein
MRIPVIEGIIDRRILVNFRVDPKILSKTLPPPFRPKLAGDVGMAGICLIRLKDIRPRHLPACIGMSSENAAHRTAVQWEGNGETREGVYIARRDTSSRLNTLLGGHVFPGVHHRSDFKVDESNGRYSIRIDSGDGKMHINLVAQTTQIFPKQSIFGTLEKASAFFEAGSVGYSPGLKEREFDGLELRSRNWKVEPLDVKQVESSFFDDRSVFPQGSVQFDCALLMRGIAHEWHERVSICTPCAAGAG